MWHTRLAQLYQNFAGIDTGNSSEETLIGLSGDIVNIDTSNNIDSVIKLHQSTDGFDNAIKLRRRTVGIDNVVQIKHTTLGMNIHFDTNITQYIMLTDAECGKTKGCDRHSMFRCTDSFNIPLYLRCNDVIDCPGGG